MDAILLFDGDCGFCRRAADRWVREGRGVRLVANASNEGQTLVKKHDLEQVVLETVVLIESERMTTSSVAVWRTLWLQGGVQRIRGGLVWLIPHPLRQVAYRWVARNRHRF